MTTPELIDYIGQCQKAGMTREQIVTALLGQGWQQADIDEALAGSAAPVPPKPPASIMTGGNFAAAIEPTPAQAAQLAQLDVLASRPTMPGNKALFMEALTLFRTHVWRLLGLALLGIVSIFAAIVIFGVLIGFGNLAGMATGTGAGMRIVTIILGLVMIAIIVGTLSWVTVASLHLLMKPSGENPLRDAFKATRGYILPFLLISVLQAMLAFGSMFILFVGPFLFTVWITFAPYVLIDENIRGMKAIVRSREIMRGRWWQVTGSFALLGLVFWVANLVLTGIPTLLGASKGSMEFLSGVLNVLFTPFAICYQVALYKHVKAARGDIGTFPKLGQMKWYWIIALLGPLILLLFIGSLAQFLPTLMQQYQSVKTLY